jgi:uncharacterized protein
LRHCIPTSTGAAFDPFDPDPDLITIVDIAHQLAGQTRWSGATSWDDNRPAITVAEHSVRVAIECPDRFKLDGLLHDAAEAYLGDIARPLKWRVPLWIAAEERLRRVIAEKFGASAELPPAVRDIDDRMQVTEFRDLIAAHSDDWRESLPDAQAFDEVIRPGTPTEARYCFLSMFYELTT